MTPLGNREGGVIGAIEPRARRPAVARTHHPVMVGIGAAFGGAVGRGVPMAWDGTCRSRRRGMGRPLIGDRTMSRSFTAAKDR